jgi:ferrochelatase
MRFVRNFHDHPGYIAAALEQSVREHWHATAARRQRPPADQLPRPAAAQPRLGDPYFCECHKTGRLLAERLNLKPEQFQICFQSRFGKAEWLQPYTAPTLRNAGARGVRRVDVICPGFVADCLETLEEIAQEGRDDFLKAMAARNIHYIPALNEDDAWIKALADLPSSTWPAGNAKQASTRMPLLPAPAKPKFGART